MSFAPTGLSRLARLALIPAAAVTGTVIAAAPAANATTPAQQSSYSTLGANHSRLSYGSVVTISGKLANASGTGLAGRQVVIDWRYSSAAKWTAERTVKTGPQGTFSFALPMRHTEQWRAVFAGESGYSRSSSTTVTTTVVDSLGTKAVRDAEAKKGDPYQYGAAGPSRFDCSGLTKYVFGELGVSLAHNAAQQYSEVSHVATSSRQVGDLVFFYDGSGIYHVGIYAGNGYMWNAPHSGTVVREEKIWTSSVKYGRVKG